MDSVEYLGIDQVDLNVLMNLLNEDSLRAHLVEHPRFDTSTTQAWVDTKLEIDSTPGARVRAVIVDGELAGWCGIQPDEEGHEIAIVLSQRFWGKGVSVFRTLMQWAEELGHSEVLFHLLDSRREYKALAKRARKVCRNQLLGRHFITYYFSVG